VSSLCFRTQDVPPLRLGAVHAAGVDGGRAPGPGLVVVRHPAPVGAAVPRHRLQGRHGEPFKDGAGAAPVSVGASRWGCTS
jgi:hypothetical protein